MPVSCELRTGRDARAFGVSYAVNNIFLLATETELKAENWKLENWKLKAEIEI